MSAIEQVKQVGMRYMISIPGDDREYRADTIQECMLWLFAQERADDAVLWYTPTFSHGIASTQITGWHRMADINVNGACSKDCEYWKSGLEKFNKELTENREAGI